MVARKTQLQNVEVRDHFLASLKALRAKQLNQAMHDEKASRHALATKIASIEGNSTAKETADNCAHCYSSRFHIMSVVESVAPKKQLRNVEVWGD